MNSAPTSATLAAASASDTAWMASIDAAILKTLSLSAPRNCVHRNDGSPGRPSVSR